MDNVINIKAARAAKAKPIKAAKAKKKKGGDMTAKAALAHLRKLADGNGVVEAQTVSDWPPSSAGSRSARPRRS